MGNVPNITTRLFPKQGDWLGRRTKVCFHFDASDIVMGTVVRDDMESPWVTIIRLDDGRVVLGTECQHSPLAPAADGGADALAPPEPPKLVRYWGRDIHTDIPNMNIGIRILHGMSEVYLASEVDQLLAPRADAREAPRTNAEVYIRELVDEIRRLKAALDAAPATTSGEVLDLLRAAKPQEKP